MNSVRDNIITMAQGNPGALNVLAGLLQSGELSTLSELGAMGVRGPQIWMLYKDLGDQTIPTLVTQLEEEKSRQRLLERLRDLGYGVGS